MAEKRLSYRHYKTMDEDAYHKALLQAAPTSIYKPRKRLLLLDAVLCMI